MSEPLREKTDTVLAVKIGVTIRETLLFELSKRLIRPPAPERRTKTEYRAWRDRVLAEQFRNFDVRDVNGKDVLDLGCGYGPLSFYLALFNPRSITGVDIDPDCVSTAEQRRLSGDVPNRDRLRFIEGSATNVPLPSESVDTIVAFDMLEHVMEPRLVLEDCKRVLRPGGKMLVWWSPFLGPWGPHMNDLVPVPWAHVLFGEKALFKAAAAIYDSASFVPRVWDLEPNGKRKANKWKAWTSFEEQGYVNQLRIDQMKLMVEEIGLEMPRFEQHGFGGNAARRLLGSLLVRLPVAGEYLTSFVVAELVKPQVSAEIRRLPIAA